MPRKYVSKWNIEEFTDAEILAAIRYLDPDSNGDTGRKDNGFVIVICTSLVLILVAWLASLWLHRRIS